MWEMQQRWMIRANHPKTDVHLKTMSNNSGILSRNHLKDDMNRQQSCPLQESQSRGSSSAENIIDTRIVKTLYLHQRDNHISPGRILLSIHRLLQCKVKLQHLS
ncbi:hypothetical protein LIER_23461 [Lithospermum erythrorhizon]|uniref:Uncharacterized protein n=1 Tax=Lithospermum erythrorhizon TaxID=34254 RepID=A0AAV3QXS3_LITER